MSVFEQAGLAFLAVYYHVSPGGRESARGLPFEAGREVRAAASPDARVLDFPDDIGWIGLQRFDQGGVAAMRNIVVNGFGIQESAVFERDAMLISNEVLGGGRMDDQHVVFKGALNSPDAVGLHVVQTVHVS